MKGAPIFLLISSIILMVCVITCIFSDMTTSRLIHDTMDYVCESMVSQADNISNCIIRTCKDDCDSKIFNSSTTVENGKERDNYYLYCEVQLPKDRAFQIQCDVDFRKSMEWKCPA